MKNYVKIMVVVAMTLLPMAAMANDIYEVPVKDFVKSGAIEQFVAILDELPKNAKKVAEASASDFYGPVADAMKKAKPGQYVVYWHPGLGIMNIVNITPAK